ncbi:MAG: hypothetical protein J6A28_04125 [Clostridia bacterium]|nr:hypothetical protein [Clostridia bacterium]
MATKKYVMKDSTQKYADGTSNEEYIMDIISQIEVLYSNITDNNDICLQLFKVREAENADEDMVDAIQLACEDAVQIEKDATDIMTVIEKVKENIQHYDKSNQLDFENLLAQMKGMEERSRKIMERVM